MKNTGLAYKRAMRERKVSREKRIIIDSYKRGFRYCAGLNISFDEYLEENDYAREDLRRVGRFAKRGYYQGCNSRFQRASRWYALNSVADVSRIESALQDIREEGLIGAVNISDLYRIRNNNGSEVFKGGSGMTSGTQTVDQPECPALNFRADVTHMRGEGPYEMIPVFRCHKAFKVHFKCNDDRLAIDDRGMMTIPGNLVGDFDVEASFHRGIKPVSMIFRFKIRARRHRMIAVDIRLKPESIEL